MLLHGKTPTLHPGASAWILIRQESICCLSTDMLESSSVMLNGLLNLDWGRFERIVVGDEHLNNAVQLVQGSRSVLQTGGLLLVSMVNAFCLRRMVRTLSWHREYPLRPYPTLARHILHLVQRFDFGLVTAHPPLLHARVWWAVAVLV